MDVLKDFSLILFSTLNRLKINYCVVGRSFSIYEDDHNGDIDIVVSKKDIKKIEEILIKLTTNTQFYLVQKVKLLLQS